MSFKEAIYKSRWMEAQRAETEYWSGTSHLKQAQDFSHTHYLSYIEELDKNLKKESHILEIGCGPVCFAQHLRNGFKTYLDPLLDDFKKSYPATLPKKELLPHAAESIPASNKSFDAIICLDCLDCTLNPELVLNEMHRLLKPAGTVILSLRVHSSLHARFRYLAERFLPYMKRERTPYSYSHKGITNTLSRYFEIDQTHRLLTGNTLFGAPMYVFICSKKRAAR